MRYKGISSVSYMERKLDNMIVGGLKLHVSIPKYGRGKKEKESTAAKQKGYKVGDIPRCNMAPEQNSKRSYAKVVTSHVENKERRSGTFPLTMARGRTHSHLRLEISEETKKRYAHTWVGRLKRPQVFERVEEELSWTLGAEVSLKYFGDDLVLLIGLSDTKAQDLMNEESNHGTTAFYELKKWNPKTKPGNRLIWVQCWGIPLVAWSIEQMRKIVAELGDLVDVDDNFEDMQRLDRARVLVRTPWTPTVEHNVTAHIDGVDHTISIVEEHCNAGVACARHHRSVWGSLEEILSDVDDTGTLQSWPTDSSPLSTAFIMHGDNSFRQSLAKPNGQTGTDSPLGITRSRKDHGLGKAITPSTAENGKEIYLEDGNLDLPAEEIVELESQFVGAERQVMQKGKVCPQHLLATTGENQNGEFHTLDQGLVGENFQIYSNGSLEKLFNKSRDTVDLFGPNHNMGLHRPTTPMNQEITPQKKPANTLQVYSRKKGFLKKRAQDRGKQIKPKTLDFAEKPSNHNHNAASCTSKEVMESPKQQILHQSPSSSTSPNKNYLEVKDDDYWDLAKELGVCFADDKSSDAKLKTDMDNTENSTKSADVLGNEDNAS
ncbi:hypothetical protein AAZV13_09G073000 [Glycine max]